MIKKIFLSITATVIVVMAASVLSGKLMISYPAGAPAGYTGSPGDGNNCTGCHLGSASISAGIITSNVPVNGYTGGNTYTITVTLPGTGVKGFEVSPQDAAGSLMGTLIAGTGSKLVGSGKYITHNAASSSDPATWVFQWTAPVSGSGDVTFYGAFAVGKLTTILSTLIVQDASITGPTITANPDTLSGFNYIFNSGPSSPISFDLFGSQLTGAPGNIALTAPTDYELSLDNISYSNALNVPYASSTLTSTVIYVRLKSGLAINTYNSELISISGGGATAVNVTCNGSVTDVPPPTLSANVSTLSGFTYIIGSGPSVSQSYNLGGTNLTGYPGNIVITAPTDYELSIDNSIFAPSLNVAYTSATLSSTPIYVRLKTGLAIASYNSEVITNAGGGATTVNVTCNGSVTDISTTCGNETFTNIPTTSSSSYSARTWTGDDGNTWNATTARTDQTLAGKAICFKGYVESPVSPNGIGDLTVTTKFPFSDGTFDLPVFVNGVQVGTVPVSATTTTTTLTGINVTGNVQVKFVSDGTKRPVIDDLSWTCFVVTDMNDFQSNYFDFSLFPNPANGSTNLLFNGPEDDVRYALYNMQGQILISEILVNNSTEVDLSALSKGIYLIKVFDEKTSLFRKLVVE